MIRLILKLKSPRPRCTFIITRGYKDYERRKFVADLANVPFHMITCFNDLDDQVEAFNNLFLNVLDEHAAVKQIKIKSRPNPFITPEIRQLMKTRDKWHKSAIRTKDKMHWNAYRFFRQEVKREIRLAEKEYVCNEIHNRFIHYKPLSSKTTKHHSSQMKARKHKHVDLMSSMHQLA